MHVISCGVITRRNFPLFSCLAVLAVGVEWGVPPAHASDVTTCTGTENVTFSPGELLLTTRSISVSYQDAYTCASTDVTITGASDSGSYTSSLSCLVPATVQTSGSYQVHWNTGATSTLAITEASNSVVAGEAVDTIVAHVDSGKFVGSQVVATITDVAPNLLDCVSEPGVTSKHGPLTMTIIG